MSTKLMILAPTLHHVNSCLFAVPTSYLSPAHRTVHSTQLKLKKNHWMNVWLWKKVSNSVTCTRYHTSRPWSSRSHWSPKTPVITSSTARLWTLPTRDHLRRIAFENFSPCPGWKAKVPESFLLASREAKVWLMLKYKTQVFFLQVR